MRVTYAVPTELNAHGGHVQHVLGLCRHAAKSGVTVRLLCVKDKTPLPKVDFEIVEIESNGDSPRTRITSFCTAALQLIQQNPKPDWVYTRPFPLDYLVFTRHLKKINVRFAYELNTLWADELRSQGKPFKALLYPFLEKLSIQSASAIFPITEEIAQRAQSSSKKTLPIKVTGNGIEIPELPKFSIIDLRKKWQLPENKKLIVMAGFTRVWHGHEKLLAALSIMSDDWQVVLVGSETPEVTEKTKQFAKKLGVGERVHVLPWLSHLDVDEVVAACDIGVSPLALEAKKMKEAQSLKVRHYLSMGIPVVIAGGEAKNILSQRFVYQVQDTDPKLLAEAFSKLAAGFKSDELRDFAKRELSWEAIAKKTWDHLKLPQEK
jgi:glycosyltransferase involved in cell wall biosynthesis